MPRIPTLDPQVAYRAGNAPAPVTLAPPAAAFGTDIGQAKERLGGAVAQVGDLLGQRAIQMQQRDTDQKVQEMQTKFQTDLQNQLNDRTVDTKTSMPKGFLQRNLDQAKGVTPEFDQAAAALKQQYLDQATRPAIKDMMTKVIDAHLTNARERVSVHEADQRDAAFKMAIDSNLQTNISNAAALNTPDALMRGIKAAQDGASDGYKHLGVPDAKISEVNAKLAGKMVSEAVSAQLETDPVRAQQIFDSVRDQIPPSDQTDISNKIKGKLIHEKQLAAWNVASNFRQADGLMDMGKVEKFAYSTPGTAEDKAQIFSFLHSMASVQDNIIKTDRESNDRAFTNTLVDGWKKGTDVNTALQAAVTSGRDPEDILKKQKDVIDLYSGQTNPFDKWLEHQDEGTKLAWEQVKSMADHKLPATKTINMPGLPEPIGARDAFMVEMKRSALGKGPDEIMKIAAEKLKDAPTPHWFNFAKPQWQIDAQTRMANSDAMLRVRTTYGDNMVKQATAFLTDRQAPVTAANLEAAIKAAAAARKK